MKLPVFNRYRQRYLNDKIKILVVADQCFWAYHEIQKFIVTNLSDKYDFYTDFNIFYKPSSKKSFKYTLWRLKSCLLALPYRRVLKKSDTYDIVVLLGFYFSFEHEISFNTKLLIKGIYTAGIPPVGVQPKDKNMNIMQFASKYLNDVQAVVCGSKLIATEFKNLLPIVKYANGFNNAIFTRLSPKTKNTSNRFIVGWTGNPNRKFKGYYDYIVPAVKEAAKKRPGIELKSRFSGPLETLPRFYDDVDVLLIASTGDAGPNMFIEGCLCEVPSISNYNGTPAEVIKDNINGFIVEREIIAMTNAIIKLYDDRELLFSFSKRIKSDHNKIRGDKIMAKAWDDLFEEVQKVNI